MSTGWTYALIVIGSLIIALLLVVIYRQIRSDQERKAQIQAAEQKQAEEAARQRDYLVESVKLIANAILHDDKITLTEGCIRLKVMIDHLDPSLVSL